MFSKNLRYFRLKKGLSKKELADRAGLSAPLITYYEEGARQPSMKTITPLSEALGVSAALLLQGRPELAFSHGAFRKNASMRRADQEYVRSYVEDYFSRLYTTLSFFSTEILPPSPLKEGKDAFYSGDATEAASKLRGYLGLPLSGPLPHLSDHLENRGFLLCPIFGVDGFDGSNGFVAQRPYIAFNADMPPERIRNTLLHELAHLYFGLGDDEETAVKEIAGQALFPKEDAVRELGYHVNGVWEWMEDIAKEYGISMYSLVYNAARYGIMNVSTEKSFYVMAARLGWRHNEPTRCEKETTRLFEQLVYRAVNENEISVQRAAELLRKSYAEVEANTRPIA